MEYKVYRLSFLTAVHLGNGSLEDGEYTFCADTLFSALCQEACKLGDDILKKLYECVNDGKVIFSDAFPYVGEIYYLPKPMKRIEIEDNAADSVMKKAYKKLKYIPAESFGDYLRGKYDVLNASDMSELGSFEMKVSAAIRGEEEAKPYRVGQYYFNQGNGLYFVMGYEKVEDQILIDQLMCNLSFSGIGGERSSGLGRFKVLPGILHPEIQCRLKCEGDVYMSLSVALPGDGELAQAMEQAEYLLIKRSGFVSSQSYAKEQMRKRDLYVFKSGSCFKQRFSGGVYDVSNKHGKHAVYRYAKPMFVEVNP